MLLGGRWSSRHRFFRLLVLGKRDYLANRSFARGQHNDPIQPIRESAMRRCAVPKGGQQEPETLFRFLPGNAEPGKNPLLHLRVVNADAARPELRPVKHQVIGAREHLEGLTIQQLEVLRPRRGEGMVGSGDLPRFFAALEQREIGHPDEFETAFLDQMEILGERWTFLIIRELLMGARRFSELQRGLGDISPALLTARLKFFEQQGLVARRRLSGQRSFEYHPTAACEALMPVIISVGDQDVRSDGGILNGFARG